jgi:sarcosine oxidase subunit delta
LRSNTRGIHAERWRHLRGCARFFNALRDTTNDRILATYRVGEQPPAVAETPP